MHSSISHLRWQLKKAARKSVALGSRAALFPALSHALSGVPRIRVLTYHRFSETPRDPFAVAPRVFEKQMTFLADRGLAVSLADVEAFVRGEKVLKDGSVLVTVDDGYQSLFSKALPILQEYGIPGVAFVTPSELDPYSRDGGNRVAPEPYLTWDQLAVLADAGIAIGSHAWTHRSLGDLVSSEVEYEAVQSREVLERHLNRPVTAFAYPFGTLADFNADTASVLQRSGYSCAFTSQHGTVRPRSDFFTLPRIKVEGGEGIWLFRLLVYGGLDGWRWIDRTLWRLQATDHGNNRGTTSVQDH
jgi:peptidoglycan/xylan/chitin deacetylase (PgdA/CDA1 family)